MKDIKTQESYIKLQTDKLLRDIYYMGPNLKHLKAEMERIKSKTSKLSSAKRQKLPKELSEVEHSIKIKKDRIKYLASDTYDWMTDPIREADELLGLLRNY